MYTKQTVTLTAAQILASFTTAIEVLPAKAGITYTVKSAKQVFNSGTTQYATNTAMKLKFSGGDDIAAITLSALPAAGEEVSAILAHTATPNTAVILQTNTGNPATGNISFDLVIEYEY